MNVITRTDLFVNYYTCRALRVRAGKKNRKKKTPPKNTKVQVRDDGQCQANYNSFTSYYVLDNISVTENNALVR